MATLEISPEELPVKNKFPFPKPGSTMVTQDDFPTIIAAIVRAANAELGVGVSRGLPARTPSTTSHTTW